MKNKEYTQIEIEEFKYIAERKKEFENRSDRRLLFCISSFGIILGFNGKIESYYIPYLLVSILLTTVTSLYSFHVLGNFTSAYVAKKFYSEKEISYETLYNKFSKRNVSAKRKKRKISISTFTNPIAFLFFVSIYSSYYFGKPILYQEDNLFIKLIYFGGIAFLHMLILYLKSNNAKYDYIYFEEFINQQDQEKE